MLAFAIDLSYWAVVHTEAQTAADSAALAGAAKLFDPDTLSSGLINGALINLQNGADVENAREEAQFYASLNKAGGLNLELKNSDIDIGYLADPSDHDSFNDSGELDYSGWPARPYNAVRVRIHRDAVHSGGSLQPFFSRVIGGGEMEVLATATAVYEMGSIEGFQIYPGGPQNSKLLPFGMYKPAWDALLAANTVGQVPIIMPDGSTQMMEITDDFTVDPDKHDPSGVTGSDEGNGQSRPDGIKEIKLYPNSDLTPGNFGTLDIGNHDNSSNDIKRQILYGPNKADFDAIGGGLFATPDDPLDLNGDTGISAGFKEELRSIIGQDRIIPVYTQVVNPGNNAEFTIVTFVGITIVDVELTGANKLKHVTIQPRFVFDGTIKDRPGVFKSELLVSRPVQLVR
jgi:hypothetical protein